MRISSLEKSAPNVLLLAVVSMTVSLIHAVEPDKDVDQLVVDLDSDNATTREEAEKALLEVGTPAIEPSAKVVTSGSAEQRFRAIRVLRTLAQSENEDSAPKARRALESLAESKDAAVSRVAVETLAPFRKQEQDSREMLALAEAFAVFDTTKETDPAKVPLLKRPLLRFRDRERNTRTGTLWAYGEKGRPLALLAVFTTPDAVGEHWSSDVVSLSDGPIRVDKVDGQPGRNWFPASSGEEFKTIPNAPTAAADGKKRLVQMLQLLTRLNARENTPKGQKPYDLTFYQEPLHRYADAEKGIVDGAIFCFAHDTNPEIIIAVEAHGKPESATWKYAYFRHSGAPLHVELEGEEIWGGDVPKEYFNGAACPYWVFRRFPKP
jgi:hypothetical protein